MNDRDEILDFIHHNSFAILITNNNFKLNATHIPILLKSDEGENGYLYGHIAKANRQLDDIDSEVLVVFSGAHKYISPTWYETDQTVPTWSYLSVHVYGKIEILEDREGKIEIVKDAVKYFEESNSNYKVEDLNEKYFEGLIKGITAFKIEITEIQGKKKISQNHPEERQKRVISELEKFSDEDSADIVRRMKNNLKTDNE
jgi:transcriptional regulator